MFLTKLKVVSAVMLTVLVGTGLAGWSYRAAAQTRPTFQPQQAAEGQRPARRTDLPAADELDALRLEIDALRKEVRADRERIKALEAEVRGQKGKPANLYQSREESGYDRALQRYYDAVQFSAYQNQLQPYAPDQLR